MRPLVGGLLGVCLILVMATALIEDFAHEWLGIATMVLTLWHLWLNRHWWNALFKGRYNLRRTILLLLDVALVGLVAAMMVSALVISRHVFSWVPSLPGSAPARHVHLVCSQWLFVVAFAHCGMHVPQSRVRRLWKKTPPVRAFVVIILVAIAALGIWSLVDTQLVPSMLGQVRFLGRARFASPHPDRHLVLGIVQYTAIATLICGTTCCIGALTRQGRQGS